MKKYIFILSLPLISLLFPSNTTVVDYDLDGYWEVSPVLSIRHDDLDSGLSVSNAIGLQMDIGGNRFTGFDTDGDDYRIYIGWGLGKLGFGHDGFNNAEYTVGATYEVLENISMDLDFVFGEDDEHLRLAILIHF